MGAPVMAQMPPSEPEVPPWVRGPSLRVRSLITLLFRLGLGLHLLNSGVTGFYMNQLSGTRSMGWSPPNARGMIYPGTEVLYQVLPYVEIVTALALLLGFLTTVAAALAAIEALAPLLFRSVVLLLGGLNTNVVNVYGPDPMGFEALTCGTTFLTLIVASALIWLSGSRCNIWSLDEQMFASRRALPPRGQSPAKTLGA
jgi:uncharacterized membrane protein YphA (DoxX/SURF4 family)